MENLKQEINCDLFTELKISQERGKFLTDKIVYILKNNIHKNTVEDMWYMRNNFAQNAEEDMLVCYLVGQLKVILNSVIVKI